MCEFLFRVRDHSSDPGTRLGRGDCVACVENGWVWSESELTHPDWRIVKVPDMSVSEAESYLVPDMGNPEFGYLPQRRKFAIDQSRFVNPATAAFVADDTRAVPFITAPAAALRNVIVQRPPLLDPSYIGPPPPVIG